MDIKKKALQSTTQGRAIGGLHDGFPFSFSYDILLSENDTKFAHINGIDTEHFITMSGHAWENEAMCIFHK